MGGDIYAESEGLGHGSSFTFWVPNIPPTSSTTRDGNSLRMELIPRSARDRPSETDGASAALQQAAEVSQAGVAATAPTPAPASASLNPPAIRAAEAAALPPPGGAGDAGGRRDSILLAEDDKLSQVPHSTRVAAGGVAACIPLRRPIFPRQKVFRDWCHICPLPGMLPHPPLSSSRAPSPLLTSSLCGSFSRRAASQCASWTTADWLLRHGVKQARGTRRTQTVPAGPGSSLTEPRPPLGAAERER